jgi:hypothetical protein
VLNLGRLLVLAWAAISGLALNSSDAIAKTPCPKVGFTVVEPHASSETRPVRAGRNQTLFVRRDLITTTSDIIEIKLAGDNDNTLILVKFRPAADQRLHDATTNHSGMRIAFVVNDEALLAVVWEGPYGMDTGGTQLSIPHGMTKARNLVKAMQGCTTATLGDQTP